MLEPGAAEASQRTQIHPGSRPLGLARLVVLVIALAVGGALVVLWPGKVDAELSEGLTADTEPATVESVELAPCPPPSPGSCGEARVRLDGGPDAGSSVVVELGGSGIAPSVEPDDQLRVARAEGPPASRVAYNVVDFERKAPLLYLALAFAALVILFGRLRGALSLLGLALSLLIVVLFVVPAILDGHAPLLVALVGSLAVMLTTISLAHGLGPKSLAAMLGTAASLILVALLAVTATELTRLTGLASEEATLLNLNVTDVSLDGLLVAGMVIGALGVLDDVTVSQASTVLALRAAAPAQRFGELYRSALIVGRDHVSATVNTLVLAYVGSSLPILLLFSSGDLGFLDVVNAELVAKEVVAMLVGSIGLICAVPMTTALAAVLARALPAGAAPLVAHQH
jgi:uncharacterized membrane protein